MREYIVLRGRPKAANIDEAVDGEDYLSRTVFEDETLIDTGVTDQPTLDEIEGFMRT